MEIIIVKGQYTYNKIRNGIFNLYGINIYGLSIHAEDTILTYSIRYDGKIAKKLLVEIQAFCQGIIYACQ